LIEIMLSTIKKIIPQKVKENLREKLLRFVKTSVFPINYRSYSQAGEDRILYHLFNTMGVTHPSYLDIGANLPIEGSNTYFFYETGSNGVCIEADPSLFENLSRIRKNDKCLNIGITYDDRKEADFYVFPIPALNTLSKEEADFREKNGSFKVQKVIKIPLKTINEIIEENFDKAPDLISIDVEGIDLEVLKSLDFNKYRPLVICAETITYSENRTERKITEILDFITSKGYFIYADTHINTIFVDEERFKNPVLAK
jgi:FkbM family methyltransferase